MTEQNARTGILLMMAASLIFAVQDGMSRYLADTYNVFLVVMVRYWFFGGFVLARAARRPGGIRAVARSNLPLVQILRGVLLASEIYIMILAFVFLGLINAHAVFACAPLVVAALSGPILGEKVGWRRWSAIGAGFVGILIILRPGFGVFDPHALLAFTAACMFALYSLLTRYVARKDSAETSFFWTGAAGVVVATLVGVWFWEPMSTPDWGWMLALCVCAAFSHWLLILAYEHAEASTIQPFAYLQLVFASTVGIVVFGDVLHTNVAVGAAVVVSAGIFALIRERQRARAAAAAAAARAAEGRT